MRPVEIPTKPHPGLFEVPEPFSRFVDVVYNLWWSWSPAAHLLFHRLSPSRWQHYRNPIDVLIDLGPEHWLAIQDDDEFTRSYHDLIEQFDDYMNPAQETWFDKHHPEHDGGPFAYFSTEFGWHESLHLYSGGLGILSGDHCKSASDLGIPFVGIGLMYRHGYFKQAIDAEGLQQHSYPDYDLDRLPLLPVVDAAGKELFVPVDLPGRKLQLRVWRAKVGRVPILLLDSDLPINHPADRPITSVLYVRGREMRLCQEIVLGVGGVLALQALGIEPGAWHLNEGHSALLCLERIRRLVADGKSLNDSVRALSTNTTFTTHTPVPAGNETFDTDLMRRYLDGWPAVPGAESDRLLALGRVGDGEEEQFNLTVLALRTCGRSNGVSALHGQVATDMWAHLLAEVPSDTIDHVTNGVHLPTWIGPEIGQVLGRHLGRDYTDELLDPGFADSVMAIPDHEIWTAHMAQKGRLIGLIRKQTLAQFARHGRSPDELRLTDDLLDPEFLTIGFARRFATYKRADLFLRDAERLRAMAADSDRPLQLVFAGKAHPADRPGQDLIRSIHQASHTPALEGRLVFLENYDMRVGRHLVQGVDLWLNTPRRPFEASGTSGMKAAMNGVLNCSILDGWWCEGYDPAHGWAIGNDDHLDNEPEQDGRDAESLYHVLSDEIIPCYYGRNEQGLPADWIRRMKHSIAHLSARFSTARMVRDYTERYYLPATRGELSGKAEPEPQS